MVCLRPIGLVTVLVTLPLVVQLATIETTSRSPPQFGNAINKVTKQLLAANESSVDVLDVRTPPRFKIQQKNKAKPQEEIENSHAGIAIPIDVEALELEATTKKLSFYKYERPTTNSGLSTWILLSGQSSTSKPTTKKPVVKPIIEDKNKEKPKENVTIVVDTKPNRIVKPIFKKKPSSTTTLPSTTTTTTESSTPKTVANVTPKIEKKDTSKLTKIKASELNNAVNKKNVSTTTASPTKKTTKPPTTTTTKSTTVPASSTEFIALNTTIVDPQKKINSITNSSLLPAEAKDQEVELEPSAESKKKPANTNKRKKNKNRRKKPGKNQTNLDRPIKNKNTNAISTQIYSYLAKEIMPTVGAGLVGLMVTAGLATYFLYPFGAARRSDTDIDRRDKEGSYYYTDDYSGGLPEEEVIGKVIAGMPINTLGSNNYKSPTSRNNYPINNNKYRFVDRRANVQPQKYEGLVKGSVESVPLGPDDYQSYKNDIDKKFVVGSVPKDVDEVTPVTVPEHGPRNLKLQKMSSSDSALAPAYGPRNLRRRKRNVTVVTQQSEDFTEDPGKSEENPRRERSGISNELDPEELPADMSNDAEENVKLEKTTTVTALNSTSEDSVTDIQQETTTVAPVNMFFDNVKYVLFLKARLALEVLRNASSMFSDYITNVQNKVESNYRNFIRRYDSV